MAKMALYMVETGTIEIVKPQPDGGQGSVSFDTGVVEEHLGLFEDRLSASDAWEFNAADYL